MNNLNSIPEIDLHNKTKDQAIDLLSDFLKESEERGYKKVRIITGKGLHTKESETTIRDDVIELLNGKYEWRYDNFNDGAIVMKL